MCGVAGILSKSVIIEPELIHKMAQSLTHRGPDGHDIYQENQFHCSHNLLKLHSKITKPGPYLSQNKRWILSFNGEIYNHQELKNEINRQTQINWRHQTDAEVLLEGWSLEGKSFLKKINGMFAFSIWDQLNKKLYLANDQFAEKNLYYTVWRDQFLFSSEIKAFQAIGCPLGLNHSKIDEYLSYRYVSGTETLFKNIFKLQPGELLDISDDLSVKRQKYEKYQINQTHNLQELIQSSIELRTSSIFTNSLFLSSGLDSTLIASHMPKNSYAMTLVSDTTVDLDVTTQICEDRQILHKQVTSPQDMTALLDESIYAIEEPIGDSIQISNMLLAKCAKEKNLRLAFTGDGADEIFAGYVHHLAFSILLKMKKNLGLSGLRLLAQTVRIVPHQLISFLAPYSQNLGSETKARVTSILNNYLNDLSPLSEMTQIFKRPNLNSEIHQSEMKISNLKELLDHDQKHWLPNYVLLRNDKLLMSQGIEGRHPYLDTRIVQYVRSLPTQYLIDGFERKSILKKAALNRLSKKVAYQKKKSFVINFDTQQLLQNTDFNQSFLKDHFESTIKKSEFLNKKKLFSLIVLQRWLNMFKLS